MQLKLQRSQRTGGLMAASIIFCLDARVVFTPQEKQNIFRYKLGNEVIYNSEAQKRAAEGSALAAASAKARGVGLGSADEFLESTTAKIGHGLKAVALGAISVLRLTITISSLDRGQHIECKSLDELLEAEDAIMAACQNLKAYLDTAATFDGREVVVDFTTGQPQIVAEATPPSMLVDPSPPGPVNRQLPPPAPESLDHAPAHAVSQTYAAEGGALQQLTTWFNGLDQAARKQVVVGGIIALIILFIVLSHL